MATNTAGTAARQLYTQQVHYLRKRITFATAAVETGMGLIPAGATVIGGGVHVITGDAAITLDVGFKDGSSTDDPNGYASALSVANVGFIALDELAATSNVQQTVDTMVTYTVLTGADTFVGDLIVTYVVDNDQ
jgi:hypothetical protein